MLTVPLTLITKHANNKKNTNNAWRFVKDWIADQVASKILKKFHLNSYSSDSDNSNASDDEHEELNIVVVSSKDKALNLAKCAKTKFTKQSELTEDGEFPISIVNKKNANF